MDHFSKYIIIILSHNNKIKSTTRDCAMVEHQDLVIETKNELSQHIHTIIIRHSHTQYYDVKDLHLKKHWTEQRSNVSQYLSILRRNGFVNVKNYGECKNPKQKSIFILEGKDNYFLDDVIVINNFSITKYNIGSNMIFVK